MPNQGDTSMDIDGERAESRGISETGDADRKQKRGTYMREGPTVYKLLKPVMKAIKEAQSLE